MKSVCEEISDPVRTAPFPPWPYFDKDEIEAAMNVLRAGKVNYWTGDEGRRFEGEFAAFVGTKHAVAVMNGTVALEAALFALNVGPGDEVIVTPRSYVASAGCVALRGAKPVFADVDPVSQNITAASIEPVITPRTRAVIAVHLAGWPCEMDDILALAQKHDLAVIEDCAQAQGARYKGRPVGSLGDVAAFSFCQDKISTTGGEGGMVTTNRKDFWSTIWSYKDHGKSYDAVYSAEVKPGPSFRWLHESFGTNGRMTEMQAAIGRMQLRKLPSWIETRRRAAAILTKSFQNIPAFRVTVPPQEVFHAYYKYYVFIRPDQLKKGWNRERVITAVNAQGIPCFSGSCSEIYREKAFDSLRPAERLPVASELGETAMMFLVHPTLSEQDILDTVKAVERVMGAASR